MQLRRDRKRDKARSMGEIVQIRSHRARSSFVRGGRSENHKKIKRSQLYCMIRMKTTNSIGNVSRTWCTTGKDLTRIDYQFWTRRSADEGQDEDVRVSVGAWRCITYMEERVCKRSLYSRRKNLFRPH